ncbi:MAG: glycosyltransferase family 2 protein, partial [Candidatus Sericytochromatia bacterium]
MNLTLEEAINKFDTVSFLSQKEKDAVFEASSKIIYSENIDKRELLDLFISWCNYHLSNNELDETLKKSIEGLELIPNSPYLLYFVSKVFILNKNIKHFLKNTFILFKEIELDDFIKTNKLNIESIKKELEELKEKNDIVQDPNINVEYTRKTKEVKKGTISACLIVKNEENIIENCLKSLVDIVDEIIIVDTGSTDKTIEIASKYTDKIFYHQWDDDFSKARNQALDEASGEWILSIDADEELTNITKEEMSLLLKQEIISAYYIIERSMTDNQINYLIRIFRNVPEIYFKGIIHEQISDGISSLSEKYNNKTSLSKIILLHHNTRRDEKNNDDRNVALLKKAIKETPVNTKNFIYYCIKLALQLSSKKNNTYGEIEEIRELFATSYKLIKDQNIIPDLEKFPILISFAVTYSLRLESYKAFNQSIELIDFAIKYFPTDIKLNYKKAALHNHQKEYIKALEYIKKCFYLFKTNRYFKLSTFDNELMQLKLPILCGSIYESLGSNQVAHEWYFETYSKAPSFPKITEILIDITKKPKLDKISVCLCIRDYSDSLYLCLEQASLIGNEIIITYLGTPSEKVINLANEYKVRLYELPSNENFETGLNNSHEMALYNWILLLQPDEMVKANKIAIKKMISKPNVFAYKLDKLDSDYYFTDKIRLFRNIPNFRYSEYSKSMAYAEEYAKNRGQLIFSVNDDLV